MFSTPHPLILLVIGLAMVVAICRAASYYREPEEPEQPPRHRTNSPS